MKKRRMAKSVRKFIRREKARIRREVLDTGQQNELILKLYKRIKPDTNTRISTNITNKNNN